MEPTAILVRLCSYMMSLDTRTTAHRSQKIFFAVPEIFSEKKCTLFLAENLLSAVLAKDNSKTNCILVFKHRNKFTSTTFTFNVT